MPHIATMADVVAEASGHGLAARIAERAREILRELDEHKRKAREALSRAASWGQEPVTSNVTATARRFDYYASALDEAAAEFRLAGLDSDAQACSDEADQARLRSKPFRKLHDAANSASLALSWMRRAEEIAAQGGLRSHGHRGKVKSNGTRTIASLRRRSLATIEAARLVLSEPDVLALDKSLVAPTRAQILKAAVKIRWSWRDVNRNDQRHLTSGERSTDPRWSLARGIGCGGVAA